MSRDDVMIEIARILTFVTDLTEAFRQVAREVASSIGAETAAMYLLEDERRVLLPVAGYRVPRAMLPVLASAVLPVDEQGFRDSVLTAAAVTWSDDVQHDPRFAYHLFRAFPHRSGVIVPVHVDGDVAGALYLVWWEQAVQMGDDRLAMLQAIGRQVALLLRSARALREAERQHGEAVAARERYRRLVDNVPIGIFRTTPDGQLLHVNPAMVEILKFPSASALLNTDARSLWVNPDELPPTRPEATPRDVRVRMRTADGTMVWVRVRSRAFVEEGQEYCEGVIEDVTAQQRAETAERQAETLRVVAQLANAASHEISNPLAIITGRLELLRAHLKEPEQRTRVDQAIAATERIVDIIARMGRLTLLQTMPGREAGVGR